MPRLLISHLRKLRLEAINVGESLRPKHDWGGLVNLEQAVERMEALHARILNDPSLTPDHIASLVCDGPAPKINLHESPVKYLERARKWVSDIRDRIDDELTNTHTGRTLLWTKISALAALFAIGISLMIWLAPQNRDSGDISRAPAISSPTASASALGTLQPSASMNDKTASARPTRSDLNLTLEELDAKYRALASRFSERESLVRELNGKNIRWTVEVLSVGVCPEQRVCVTFLSLAHSQLAVTTAEFPQTFRERLYALHPGDKITLWGSLKAGIYGNMWTVEATEYELALSHSNAAATPELFYFSRTATMDDEGWDYGGYQPFDPAKVLGLSFDEFLKKYYSSISARARHAFLNETLGFRVSWEVILKHISNEGINTTFFFEPIQNSFGEPLPIGSATFTNPKPPVPFTEGDTIVVQGKIARKNDWWFVDAEIARAAKGERKK